MKLDYIVATLHQPSWTSCIHSWQVNASAPHDIWIFENKEILEAYRKGIELSDADILSFCHDDLLITEVGWDKRVLKQFEDPKVGIVGFAGGVGHGNPNLYKVPYHLPNLARQRFMSNMFDAEQHGERFTGERDVTVLDGLALFIRRELLERTDGWGKGTPISYFMYSEFMCCVARRLGYKIRLVGVSCHHLGGKSSGLKPDQVFDYEAEHRFIFDHFSDVLPARVED